MFIITTTIPKRRHLDTNHTKPHLDLDGGASCEFWFSDGHGRDYEGQTLCFFVVEECREGQSATGRHRDRGGNLVAAPVNHILQFAIVPGCHVAYAGSWS